MGTNNVSVEIVDLVEAPNYNQPDWAGLSVEKVIIVKKGTKAGNPTIDLQFVDDKGNKSVAMLTAKIFGLIAGMIEGCEDSSG